MMRIIGYDVLPTLVVSTISLPPSHLGPTYETAVFPGNGKKIASLDELAVKRYYTEDDARKGHREMVHRCVKGEICDDRQSR